MLFMVLVRVIVCLRKAIFSNCDLFWGFHYLVFRYIVNVCSSAYLYSVYTHVSLKPQSSFSVSAFNVVSRHRSNYVTCIKI